MVESCRDLNNTNQKAWRYLYETSLNGGCFNRTAIISNEKEYTYDQMFRLWLRYGAVFSALSMTGKDNSKVGIVGSSAPEVIFSIYGLNITGAKTSIIPLQDYLNADKIISSIKSERFTDLILTDDFLQDKVLYSLFEKKKNLGLKNIILLHTSLTSVTIPKKISSTFNKKNSIRRQMLYCYYIDYLLLKFGDGPIYYEETTRQSSIYIHTSGTTSGIGKSIGLSDFAINNICESMLFLKDDYPFLGDNLLCPVSIDLSNSFGFVDQVHLTFGFGGTIVCVPGVSLNPLFPKIIGEKKTTLLYINGFGLEVWMNYPEEIKLDFSSLKGIVIGGSYVSRKGKKRYYEFFKKHGCKDAPIVIGYGISEFGGVISLAKPDLNDESVGNLITGVEAILRDEENGNIYTVDDGCHEGVLYLRSDYINTIESNGSALGKLEIIKGKTYFCTNDLIRFEDKELIYLGRSHQYYLNKGIVYQAGRVEIEVGKCDGINTCGIVPIYDKFNHDNLPMLCVETLSKDISEALEIVKSAITDVFVNKKILPIDNIPFQIMITDNMPHNTNGKVDLYSINKGLVKGQRYKVKTLYNGSGIKEIDLVEIEEDVSNVWDHVYKKMAKDIIPEPAISIGETLFDNLTDFDSNKFMEILLKMLEEDGKYSQKYNEMEISDIFEKYQQFQSFIFQQQQTQFITFTKQLNNFGKSFDCLVTGNKGDKNE